MELKIYDWISELLFIFFYRDHEKERNSRVNNGKKTLMVKKKEKEIRRIENINKYSQCQADFEVFK